MTRERLARFIWKLWKKRNFYKRWYEYEVEERKVWWQHVDGLNEQIKDLKHRPNTSTDK